MKNAILRHDDTKGFVLIDKETDEYVASVEVGDNEEEVDWELVEKQANEAGYMLD